MTDRYSYLTVAIKKDIREDDAQPLINAIRMMKGVIGVKGHVDDRAVYAAQERLKHEWYDKLGGTMRELMWGEDCLKNE